MPAQRNLIRRTGAAVLAAGVLLVAAGWGPHDVGAAPGDGLEPAIGWLAAELAAGGHHLSTLGRPDWGATADALLAAAAADRLADADFAATTAALLDHLDAYTTWDDLGPEYAGVRLAGPLSKALLIAQLAGRPGSLVDPLEAELRSLVQTSGPDAGRASDRNPHSPDETDGFDQSLAVLALDRTDGGAPAPTVSFLVAQQCPSGGFRLIYGIAGGCTSDEHADTDATAVAVQALLSVERTPEVAAALADAVGWLLSIQDPATGAFVGTGPTASVNANSTGLIVQALRGAGQTAAADRGSDWVRSLQLITATSPVTATDLGAIAYDPAAFAAGRASGIAGPIRDQWQRTTAQALLAFGLPTFGSIGGPAPEPVDPTPGSPTSSSTSTTSTTAGPTSTTSTSEAPATSTTSTTSVPGPTSTFVPSAGPPAASVLGGSATRTPSSRRSTSVSSGSSGSSRALATTGVDVDAQAALGGVLLLAGAILVSVGRLRPVDR